MHLKSVLLSDKDILKSIKIDPLFCHGYDGLIAEMIARGEIYGDTSYIQRSSPKQRISNGLTSFGYDLTLAPKFKIFTNVHNTVVDPLDFNSKSFVDHSGDSCIIPPNSFVLAESVERIEMPSDCLGICVGKSSYARCGIFLGITPIEPGWCGTVTIEISNTTPLQARVHAHQGIAQLFFLRNDGGCHLSYADKKGKYQGQSGITLPR